MNPSSLIRLIMMNPTTSHDEKLTSPCFITYGIMLDVISNFHVED